MQITNTIESQEEELIRLRKLVKEQESTIAALRQDLNNHRQAELNVLRSANAARNDADRFERTKNKMTRYGRNF